MASKKRKKAASRYFDWGMVFIVLFLAAFGLVMLYSVSSYNAQIKFDDGTYYVRKQAIAVVLGVVAMVFISLINYHVFYMFSTVIYAASILLNLVVMFTGAGATYGGSTRWISVAGMSFQPSETAKIAVIIFLASQISRVNRNEFKSFKTILKYLIMCAPAIIIVAVSNLSTALIIAGIAVIMLFVASPKYLPFAGIAVLAVGFAAVFIMMFSYRMTRIKVWLDPASYDEGYQTLQGLYAIGSGGIFGKGLGESLQKLGYVPEPENDMIFSIICEELGLVGAICIILLFLMLIWRFMVIAQNAGDIFGSFLSIGVMTHIALQVILNIAVVTNSFPNTGVTLPFISYGGTSTTFLFIEVGIVLSVSHGIRLENLEDKKEELKGKSATLIPISKVRSNNQ